jgi:copper(I)-binding protein
MNKYCLILLIGLVSLNGCSDPGPAISISQLQVVAPAPGRRPSVAYMTISNRGQTDVELTSVSSSQFALVEMHETVLKDGVARMKALSGVTISANNSVEFAPSGKHLMLFEPTKGLTPGTEISLEFAFASGEILVISSLLKTRIPID